MIPVESLFIPSVIMGLGIAIDVGIATVVRFRDHSMSFSNWTLPVAATHILLPAIGYYSWWYLNGALHDWSLLFGLIAFSLISIFVYQTFCGWIGSVAAFSLEPLTAWIVQPTSGASRGRAMMVLAVSMDALWSGPAKSAQAVSGHWSSAEVVISFLIAGGVVALVAQVSLLIAYALRRVSWRSHENLNLYLVVAKYLELTILFGFGVLALWNAFERWIGLGSLYLCVGISALIMGSLWGLFWKPLMQQQQLEL